MGSWPSSVISAGKIWETSIGIHRHPSLDRPRPLRIEWSLSIQKVPGGRLQRFRLAMLSQRHDATNATSCWCCSITPWQLKLQNRPILFQVKCSGAIWKWGAVCPIDIFMENISFSIIWILYPSLSHVFPRISSSTPAVQRVKKTPCRHVTRFSRRLWWAGWAAGVPWRIFIIKDSPWSLNIYRQCIINIYHRNIEIWKISVYIYTHYISWL